MVLPLSLHRPLHAASCLLVPTPAHLLVFGSVVPILAHHHNLGRPLDRAHPAHLVSHVHVPPCHCCFALLPLALSTPMSTIATHLGLLTPSCCTCALLILVAYCQTGHPRTPVWCNLMHCSSPSRGPAGLLPFVTHHVVLFSLALGVTFALPLLLFNRPRCLLQLPLFTLMLLLLTLHYPRGPPIPHCPLASLPSPCLCLLLRLPHPLI